MAGFWLIVALATLAVLLLVTVPWCARRGTLLKHKDVEARFWRGRSDIHSLDTAVWDGAVKRLAQINLDIRVLNARSWIHRVLFGLLAAASMTVLAIACWEVLAR